MSKIHMICGIAPNESDTLGDENHLCGTEGDGLNATRDKRMVNCKRCLKLMRNLPGDRSSE